MKKGFSLLELIFVIALLALIAAFALPNFLNTKQGAVTATVKRDIVTITNAIQSYYMLNGKIDNINSAVSIPSKDWVIDGKTAKYKECITIEVNDSKIQLKLNSTDDTICKKLEDSGVEDSTIQLY